MADASVHAALVFTKTLVIIAKAYGYVGVGFASY